MDEKSKPLNFSLRFHNEGYRDKLDWIKRCLEGRGRKPSLNDIINRLIFEECEKLLGEELRKETRQGYSNMLAGKSGK